jgi:hypothetical protein
MKSAVIVGLAILGLLPVWSAEAAVVTGILGDQDLVSGTFHPSGDLTSANAGDPAIFNSNCGSDTSANCNLTWSLSYSIPASQTITGATLTLGIWDIDSAVAGDQVATYTLNGADLTGLLNAQANSLGVGGDGKFCSGPSGPNTVFCSQYDVFTVTVPNAALGSLATGPATVVLTLQGPGHGVLGNTNFNGAIIDFSQLDITTAPSENNGNNVPEPATLTLLAGGLSGIVMRRLVRRVSGA